MGYFPETYSISSSFAFLWVLYPMVALVGIELFLRAMSNDDDDDDEGGGVMSPVYQGIQLTKLNKAYILISIITQLKCIKHFSFQYQQHISFLIPVFYNTFTHNKQLRSTSKNDSILIEERRIHACIRIYFFPSSRNHCRIIRINLMTYHDVMEVYKRPMSVKYIPWIYTGSILIIPLGIVGLT